MIADKEEIKKLLIIIDGLRNELDILKNPSDGRCMEIAALREERKHLIKKIQLLESKLATT